MIRRAFFGFTGLCTIGLVCLLGVKLGPVVEGRFWPIRVAQSIQEIVRTPDRLCWTWVSVKVRDAVSDNMDVFLDTRTDRSVVAVFERDTGMPWSRSRAVGTGPHRQAYCVLLPPNVTATESLRIEQVAYYPGFLSLWHTAVQIPDIVDPPDAALP